MTSSYSSSSYQNDFSAERIALSNEIMTELHSLCRKHKYEPKHLFEALSPLDPNFSLVGCELQQLRRSLAGYACPAALVKDLIQYRRRLMSRSYFMRSNQRREDQAMLREKEYQAVLDEIDILSNHIAALDMEIDNIQSEKSCFEQYISSNPMQAVQLYNTELHEDPDSKALLVTAKVHLSLDAVTFARPTKPVSNFSSRCHDQARAGDSGGHKKRMSSTRSTNSRSMLVSM